MVREPIVRVFRQLRRDQPVGDMRYRLVADRQQNDAAGRLQEAVERFEEDADPESPVGQLALSEPVNLVGPSFRQPTAAHPYTFPVPMLVWVQLYHNGTAAKHRQVPAPAMRTSLDLTRYPAGRSLVLLGRDCS